MKNTSKSQATSHEPSDIDNSTEEKRNITNFILPVVSGEVSKKKYNLNAIIYQSLVSSKRSLLPSNPIQAFKKLSKALRCLLRLLTTSVPRKSSCEKGFAIIII
jgi:hypothetical protein